MADTPDGLEEIRSAFPTDSPLTPENAKRLAVVIGQAYRGYKAVEVLELHAALDQAIYFVTAYVLAAGNPASFERLRDAVMPHMYRDRLLKLVGEILDERDQDGRVFKRQVDRVTTLRNKVAHTIGDQMFGLTKGLEEDEAARRLEEVEDVLTDGARALAVLLAVLPTDGDHQIELFKILGLDDA